MDLLKKHFEKIALAIVLVALIVSAVMLALRVSAVTSEPPPDPTSGKPGLATHVEFGAYSNALVELAQPPVWTNDNGLVRPGTEQRNPDTNPVPTTETVVLTSIVRKPFKLLFKTYSFDATAKDGYNFQINFQFRSRTFFISHVNDPIKDRYEDTGYKITKFEKKSVVVTDPTLNIPTDKDVSELTVQHEGGNPVVLVLGKESEDQEPVAQVRCGAGGAIREYRRGQSFECEGKKYRVIDIDIDQKQMIIIDSQTQQPQNIKSQQ